MNNDFDQIEKMLAERLRSIDAPGASADAAWDALSAKLPAPKRKRRFFFLLWGLLLISAASTAIYFYHKPTSNGVQISANNNQPKANSEQPTENSNQLSASGNQPTANSDQLKADEQQLSSPSQKPRTISQEQLLNAPVTRVLGNQELITKSQEPRTQSQELITKSQEPRTKSQEPNPNPQTLALITPRFSLLPLDAGSVIVKNTKSQPVAMADPAPVVPSPWSIKAALGYNLLSPKDAAVANYYPLLGNYVQASGKYSWAKTYAEAGIQHATWKYGIDYLKTTTDKVLIEDTLLSMVVNAQTGAIISEVYGDTLVNRTTTRKVRYNNAFSTIQVPLEFGYYISKNKWQFEAGLGVNLIYVYKQSGRYLTTDSDITGIITSNNLGVKQFVIQPQLSIGTSYIFHPKWTVGLEAGAGLIPSSWVPSGINKNLIPLNVGISVVKKF
jgi:hypothetical protein